MASIHDMPHLREGRAAAMAPSERPPAGGRVVFDVTTLMNARGPAHGISRLLGKTLGDLVPRIPDLALCAYDQGRRRFRALRAEPSTVADQLTRVSENQRIEIEAPLPRPLPIDDGKPNLLSRTYFALPIELQARVRRAATLGREMAGEIGQSLRYPTSARRAASPLARAALGETIDFGPGDTLFQGGALWNSHGIAKELFRIKDTGAKVMSLVYDIIPVLRPEFFDDRMAGRFAGWIAATIEASEHIVAISATTRDDVQGFAAQNGLRAPASSVLHLGDDALTDPPAVVDGAVAAVAERPFVLCLGTLEVRKNHRLLYQVWRRLAEDADAPRLVIVGQRGWLTEETEALLKRDRLVCDKVVVVRGAGDGTVAWLLAHALFTVYPSFYEGWGLPVAESLAAGRLVVASDAPAVREAGQGLAIHLPCDDVPQWTDTVRSLARDPERRAAIEADIATRLVRQSWAQASADLATTISAFVK